MPLRSWKFAWWRINIVKHPQDGNVAGSSLQIVLLPSSYAPNITRMPFTVADVVTSTLTGVSFLSNYLAATAVEHEDVNRFALFQHITMYGILAEPNPGNLPTWLPTLPSAVKIWYMTENMERVSEWSSHTITRAPRTPNSGNLSAWMSVCVSVPNTPKMGGRMEREARAKTLSWVQWTKWQCRNYQVIR